MNQHLQPSSALADNQPSDVAEKANVANSSALSLSTAHALILQGNLQDAEELLSRMIKSGANPEALDLLARVYAQKGRWSQAKATWEGVLELAPEHVAALAALRRLSSPRKAEAVFRRCAVLAGLAVCVFLGTVGLLTLTGVVPKPQPASLPDPQGNTTFLSTIARSVLEPAPMDQASHVPEPPLLPTNRPDLIPFISLPHAVVDATQPPIPRLDIAGCTVSTNAHGPVIIFNEGLFRYRCELSAFGETVLINVATALSECPSVNKLLIEGHTDNDPMPPEGPYPSNYALGFARAATVAAWFRDNTTVAPSALVATSLGSEEPPFSNEEYDSRLRNRTVVLRIQFAEEGTGRKP